MEELLDQMRTRNSWPGRKCSSWWLQGGESVRGAGLTLGRHWQNPDDYPPPSEPNPELQLNTTESMIETRALFYPVLLFSAPLAAAPWGPKHSLKMLCTQTCIQLHRRAGPTKSTPLVKSVNDNLTSYVTDGITLDLWHQFLTEGQIPHYCLSEFQQILECGGGTPSRTVCDGRSVFDFKSKKHLSPFLKKSLSLCVSILYLFVSHFPGLFIPPKYRHK